MGERRGEKPHKNPEEVSPQSPHRDRFRVFATLGFAIAGTASMYASTTMESPRSDNAFLGGLLLLTIAVGGTYRLIRNY